MTALARPLLRTAAEIVTAVGGLSLALTIQMHWVSRGEGSTLDGYNLASALRRLPARDHPWALEAAIGIYGVAAIGCITLMTAFWRNPIAVWIRGVLVLVPALVLLILSLRGAVPMGLWSSGAVVTVAASLLCVLSAVLLLTCSGEETQ
jgi:hypothetical protein